MKALKNKMFIIIYLLLVVTPLLIFFIPVELFDFENDLNLLYIIPIVTSIGWRFILEKEKFVLRIIIVNLLTLILSFFSNIYEIAFNNTYVTLKIWIWPLMSILIYLGVKWFLLIKFNHNLKLRTFMTALYGGESEHKGLFFDLSYFFLDLLLMALWFLLIIAL